MAETRFDSSSFVLRPSSLAPDLASRRDDVFADLGRESVGDRVGQLLESDDSAVLAAATVRPSEEATGAKVPRRSRLLRYERELDDWFAALAAEEVGR